MRWPSSSEATPRSHDRNRGRLNECTARRPSWTTTRARSRSKRRTRCQARPPPARRGRVRKAAAAREIGPDVSSAHGPAVLWRSRPIESTRAVQMVGSPPSGAGARLARRRADRLRLTGPPLAARSLTVRRPFGSGRDASGGWVFLGDGPSIIALRRPNPPGPLPPPPGTDGSKGRSGWIGRGCLNSRTREPHGARASVCCVSGVSSDP
jgi:hypothetical protein